MLKAPFLVSFVLAFLLMFVGAPSLNAQGGGMNLDGYCQSNGHLRATFIDGRWRCERSQGGTSRITMSSACRWQYGNAASKASQNYEGNAESWFCHTSRIKVHGNGWCSAKPASSGVFGVEGIDLRLQLYFDPMVNPGAEYYFYYRNNYVGPDVVKAEGPSNEHNQYLQVGVDTTWAMQESFRRSWARLSNWRLDYRCLG